MRVTEYASVPKVILVAAVLVVANKVAPAGVITLVDSRSDIGADDFVDFDPLGNDGDVLASPLSLNSDGGLSVTLFSNVLDDDSETNVTLSTLNGFQSVSADGSVSAGTGFTTIGAFTINFDNPVASVGADFVASGQFNGFFEEVRLQIRRVDDSTEIFTLAGGQVDGHPENNDPSFSGFAGVTSTEADIRQISFQAWSHNAYGATNGSASLEINRLDLSETVGSPNPVPEPASLALLSLGGGLSLFGYGLRCRRG